MFLLLASLLSFAVLAAACDSGSDPSPSDTPATSQPPGTNGPTSGPTTQAPTTKLVTTRWGATFDGLLSVVVKNEGTTTVQSARAIITARDAAGNVVAAVSAPIGTRCCTIIGLSPGKQFGLYSGIGTRISRVDKVSVQFADVRTSAKPVRTPLLSMKHASLRTSGDSAEVTVSVATSGKVGPYITAQAFINRPDGKFLAVISGGFYCLKAGTTRVIRLQLFHPVPPGSSVDSVIAVPLDGAAARAQKLPRCNTR